MCMQDFSSFFSLNKNKNKFVKLILFMYKIVEKVFQEIPPNDGTVDYYFNLSTSFQQLKIGIIIFRIEAYICQFL